MKSIICLLAFVAYASAGAVLIEDDGQWRPWLDGSILGASPGLATAALGAASVVPHAAVVPAHGLLGGHLLAKRSLGHVALGHGIVNPNALNVPLDTVHVAAAKNAQLISQATEGTRNILGGGIPLALPADTHEVAAGKVAHAIAHETQKWATASHGAVVGAAAYAAPAAAYAAPAVAYAAPAAVAAPVVATRVVPATALSHDAQVVAPAVGHAAVVGGVVAPAAAAYVAPAAAYVAPAAIAAPVVAARVVPATAITHDAQVVAPAVGHAAVVGGVVGTGLVGHGLVGGLSHGWVGGHGLLARHW